jgi:hypothetical protein
MKGMKRSDARKRMEELKHQERCTDMAAHRESQEKQSSHSIEWFRRAKEKQLDI